MTQAYNLAILANAVDTSGRLNVGTNATGVLPVANGGTGLSSTPSNGQLNIGNGSGFTRATLTAGSGISITNGAGSITIASSGGAGTVTSVATGNGLSGGTITTTGTLAIAAPGANTVGSYALVNSYSNGSTNFTFGSSYGIGFNPGQVYQEYGGLSGSWRWMNGTRTQEAGVEPKQLVCRVS